MIANMYIFTAFENELMKSFGLASEMLLCDSDFTTKKLITEHLQNNWCYFIDST
jgi:hypothetical protein